MIGSPRRTRFQERVRIEREFLEPVNAAFGSVAPLAGMTAAAIRCWEARIGTREVRQDVGAIAAVLYEAAARAELLADNSKDVFERRERGTPNGLSELKELLFEALRHGD